VSVGQGRIIGYGRLGKASLLARLGHGIRAKKRAKRNRTPKDRHGGAICRAATERGESTTEFFVHHHNSVRPGAGACAQNLGRSEG
jgi:hypothetical protein